MILAPNRFSHIQLKTDSSKFLGADANVGQAEEELAVRGAVLTPMCFVILCSIILCL
jgi:hypothetical protein